MLFPRFLGIIYRGGPDLCRRMPQGDFLNFSSTAWATGLSFVLGYFMFVGVWLPRLGLTFAARAWVTSYTRTPLNSLMKDSNRKLDFTPFTLATVASVVSPTGGMWPEIFLFGVEFVGLLMVVTAGTFPRGVYPLMGIPHLEPVTTTPKVVTYMVANLLGLWTTHRSSLSTNAIIGVHEVIYRAAITTAPVLPVVLPRLKMAATLEQQND